jgi:hypothetical protein
LLNIAFELDYGRLSDDPSNEPLVRMCRMHKGRDVDDLFQQVAKWLEEPGVLPKSLAVETFALMSRGHMLRRGDTLAQANIVSDSVIRVALETDEPSLQLLSPTQLDQRVSTFEEPDMNGVEQGLKTKVSQLHTH